MATACSPFRGGGDHGPTIAAGDRGTPSPRRHKSISQQPFSVHISTLARQSATTYSSLYLRVFDCPCEGGWLRLPRNIRRPRTVTIMSCGTDDFEIPEDKIRQAKTVFSKYDKRGLNKMSTTDLGPAFYALNLQMRDDALKEWADLVDEEATGYIDEAGFLALFEKKLRDDADEKDLRDAFRSLDKNKRGEIDVADLRWILSSLGDDLSAEEIEEMIANTDTDGSGFVDFDEFYKLMTG